MKQTTEISASSFYGPFGRGGVCSGAVSPAWAPVRAAFEENFALNYELGAQLVIYEGEDVVVNLNGKSSKQKFYSEDTLQNIFSSGKNMEAVCMAILVDRGLVTYDDLVSKHWPEFGKHGKEHVTIADVLRHEGGVPFFSDFTDLSNGKKDTRLTREHFQNINFLERTIENSGFYNLHSKRHYHAVTRGWLLSGIIRRVDPLGRTLGKFMRDEVCTPLSLDIFCGMEPSLQAKYEFADVKDISIPYMMSHLIAPAVMGVGDPTIKAIVDGLNKKADVITRHNVSYFTSITNVTRMVSTEEVRALEWPSGGMQANGKSIAKINALFANGGSLGGCRLLSEEAVTEALSEPKVEFDHLMSAHTSFTKGGFAQFSDITSAAVVKDFSAVYEGFVGWCGMGGSVSLWHPQKRVAVAYVMNAKTMQLVGGPRSDRIFRAIQKVLRQIK